MKTTASGRRTWRKTNIVGLYIHSGGGYYFRTKVGGKQIWETLRTNVKSVAEAEVSRRRTLIRKYRSRVKGARVGTLSVGQALQAALQDVEADATIRPNTKRGRREGARALLASWPELADMDPRKLTARQVKAWSDRVRGEKPSHIPFGAKTVMRNSKGCSTSKHNGMLDILRMALDFAVRHGAAFENAARDATISRPAQKPKALVLPKRADFPRLVAEMRKIGGNAKHSADLVELLAYTGARLNEARNLLWSDVNFAGNKINLRVTKNGDPRMVPMMEELKALLKKMREESPDARPESTVAKVFEAQKSIDNACIKAGIARITHHDLRHLFATTCIEAGIDIPTVARLLGHKDGGALAMKTYGHLRDEHAQRMIKLVSYSGDPAAGNEPQ